MIDVAKNRHAVSLQGGFKAICRGAYIMSTPDADKSVSSKNKRREELKY
jgi:hypothetical protein